MKSVIRSHSFALISLIFLAAVAMTVYIGTSSSRADFRSSDDTIGPKPAGRLLLDTSTGSTAVAPLTMNFVRTPDTGGPGGKGRYLIAVNSGYGIEHNSKSKANQTLSVIDLNLKPEPAVIQNVYFPSPESANFGLAFDTNIQSDGKYRLYVAGGTENKIWMLGFDPGAAQPLLPQNRPDTKVAAPSIDVSAFAQNAPSPDYNRGVAPVYPTGIAVSPDGNTIYSANNLGDTLGIVSDLRLSRKIDRVDLHRANSTAFLYPYDVKLLTSKNAVQKSFVSLWGDGTVAVVHGSRVGAVSHILVGRHPTLMLLDNAKRRLFVTNSDDDSVSVVDTASEKVIETINVRLAEGELNGSSPEGLALSDDERTLFVANAHSNSVAVVSLKKDGSAKTKSKLSGFIPAGSYPSAVAVIGERLFIANGKGTGMENSSTKVTETGLYPNMPNKDFPGGASKRGEYSVAIVSGNISTLTVPDEKRLYQYTQDTMRNSGMLGEQKRSIFAGGRSPFKHVIYVIRENRTYDQVFGDVVSAGGGQKADGEPSVAIFGAGDAAKSPTGTRQNVTPNAHSLAARFGLLDRFFVNAEASPDGHNWSTAAFSNDYVDKAFRWNYSGRGRTYDYEGFNRLPSFDAPSTQPPVALPSAFRLPATAENVADLLKKYVPYLNGGRDVGEPQSLYLWDAASRAGLSYRNYGEFVSTISTADLAEVNAQKAKKYPDTSPTLNAFAAKKTLEGHFSPQGRNFDMLTPDSFTTMSYAAARSAGKNVDPAITDNNAEPANRGTSRYGAWSAEFRGFVDDLSAGRGDHLPNLSIVRLSNDHTSGLRRNSPTPQFYVAENDFALGRLVEDVSKSPYWKDTAIFVVEDDAQDGPDHVDAHRSPALVISAYNRRGALVHEFHNTVSLIRTLELCLGLPPMNFLDAHATPIDIFTSTADLTPYTAELPNIALDNLYPPEKQSARMSYYMNLTDRQDLSHPDMANARELNEIIWYSVKGDAEMPGIARLPAFDLMTAGLKEGEDKDDRGEE